MHKLRRISAFKMFVLAVAVVVLVILVKSAIQYAQQTLGSITPEGVAVFLEECGWQTSGDAQVEQVTIPAKFSEVYEQYNELQKKQGYDLMRYRTDTVTRYTYKIANFTDSSGNAVSDVYAHVLVSGSRIIGGDICSTALNGFMVGLRGEE